MTVSASSMAPSPHPKINFLSRVCTPAAWLKLVDINPCSFVQLENIFSFVLKRVNPFSVLMIKSSSKADSMQ